MDWKERTKLLIGNDNVEKLSNTHVIIVGLGGVGAYAAENLCRAGVGELTIIDSDTVHNTNINRQLLALNSTIDRAKADVLENRLLDINPNIIINTRKQYLDATNVAQIINKDIDYVVDAIDTLNPKFNLIFYCIKNKIPIISSMGSGGKKDATSVKITDISNSYNCTLARALRKKLHRNGIYKGFDVVFSSEKTEKETVIIEESLNKKSNVGTISYMPAIFGCFIASGLINDLIRM